MCNSICLYRRLLSLARLLEKCRLLNPRLSKCLEPQALKYHCTVCTGLGVFPYQNLRFRSSKAPLLALHFQRQSSSLPPRSNHEVLLPHHDQHLLATLTTKTLTGGISRSSTIVPAVSEKSTIWL
ncbi:hypothetical protein BDZ45DRAFT_336223 [Acephala macrosclerotiorum]|nr:hypothetical protein BDZ45DRAFT_336223 [Acephala macrosclerotiorum]